jgi:anti-anti-sigma factor
MLVDGSHMHPAEQRRLAVPSGRHRRRPCLIENALVCTANVTKSEPGLRLRRHGYGGSMSKGVSPSGSGFDFRAEFLEDGLVCVVVRGELDMAVADVLLLAVAGALCTDGVRSVEIDSSGLRFIDACGVSALLTAHKEAQAQGKSFRLCGTSGLPLRVLEITGVLGLLTGKELRSTDDRHRHS